MRWTIRLKRHGGLQALLEKRLAQIDRIRRLQQVSLDEFLKNCLTWLYHHPLRVLNPLSVEILDDIETKVKEMVSKATFPQRPA